MSQEIEDSGLTCPWCGYNVTALTKPTCPECGKRFVLAKPGVIDEAEHRTFRISSGKTMVCRECGHDNPGFMPARCGHCGKRFTLMQRIFGTHPFRIG